VYRPIFLKTENQLNKILRQQKRTRSDMAVLFLSLWDEKSMELMTELEKLENPSPLGTPTPLYVVDSFTMPHAFVIFNTTKLPHLVQFKRGKCDSEDYLSRVYRELGL